MEAISEQNFSYSFEVSAEKMMLLFDVCFFSTYAVGWTLTYFFNNEFLADNGVIRAFGVHNLCIGVDSNPARLFAIPFSYITMFFYIASAAISFQRMLTIPGRYKIFRGALLALSVPLSLGFCLSYGVEPVDAPTLRLHTEGFAVGLIGLSMLKVSSVLEFRNTRPHHEGDPFGLRYCNRKSLIFVATEVFMVLFLLLASSTLLLSLAGKSDAYITERLAVPASELNPKFDWYGLGLSLANALSPIVIAWTAPKRSHADLTFRFQRNYIADDDELTQL